MYYARKNSFGLFTAYSPRVSGIPQPSLQYRELLGFGISYNRQLSLSKNVSWQYSAELLPVELESDPLSHSVDLQTAPITGIVYDFSEPAASCTVVSEPYSFKDPISGTTYSGTVSTFCQGRRWTVGEAMSPVGMQWNFRPHRKIQPIIGWHGGYMYSSRPIPLEDAGSFNFTVDIDAGVEIYRSRSKSIRAEYRYHHLSNANTAQENPGVDSGLFQLTYCFGLGRQ
jgi:hypothetical protein